MKIAVISDSHDNAHYINKSINFINRLGADLCLHCGDFVLPQSFELFKKIKIPFKAVFGNNDIYYKNELLNIARGFCTIEPAPFEFEIFGKKILMMHAPYALEAYAKSQKYDFIFYAHTHAAKIYKEGKTCIVNPGELSGARFGRATLAQADTDGTAEIFDIDLES